MGLADKAKPAAEDCRKAKEVIGNVTNNDSLKNQGKADQPRADVKSAGESITTAFTR